MYLAFFLALLVGGVAIAIFGIKASPSLASDFSRFFTHAPTNKAIWMLFGGVVLFTAGMAGLLH